jgi:hypothetical protein
MNHDSFVDVHSKNVIGGVVHGLCYMLVAASKCKTNAEHLVDVPVGTSLETYF